MKISGCYDIIDQNGKTHRINNVAEIQVRTHTNSSSTGNFTRPTYLEFLDEAGNTIAVWKEANWCAFYPGGQD